MTEAPAVVLVGGGHAHVEILRRLAEEEHPAMAVTLVNPSPVHHYSGMAPGYVAGLYREAELTFDLAALARRAGARLVLAAVTAIDPEARILTLGEAQNGEAENDEEKDGGETMEAGDADPGELAYDLVSFDVGSGPAGAGTPGFPDHALAVKPLSRALAVRRRLLELAAKGGDGPRRVVVVGAGAAGFEVACAAARALDDAGGDKTGVPRRVTLLDAGPCILPSYDDAFRRRARRALDDRRVEARTGSAVERLEEGAVVLEGGERLASDLTVWLTGPAAPRLFQGSGLPLDDSGFLLIDETLRPPGQPRIFATGDCATPLAAPDTPKAGVFAVRQAPLLWRALCLAAEGRDPAEHGVSYRPDPGYLSLLNTCDGRALFSWKGLSAHARWAWWLKDWIDRRFMRRYRS